MHRKGEYIQEKTFDVLGVHHEERRLDRVDHMRRHEAEVRLRGVLCAARLREAAVRAERHVLHRVDVLHVERVVRPRPRLVPAARSEMPARLVVVRPVVGVGATAPVRSVSIAVRKVVVILKVPHNWICPVLRQLRRARLQACADAVRVEERREAACVSF